MRVMRESVARMETTVLGARRCQWKRSLPSKCTSKVIMASSDAMLMKTQHISGSQVSVHRDRCDLWSSIGFGGHKTSRKAGGSQSWNQPVTVRAGLAGADNTKGYEHSIASRSGMAHIITKVIYLEVSRRTGAPQGGAEKKGKRET